MGQWVQTAGLGGAKGNTIQAQPKVPLRPCPPSQGNARVLYSKLEILHLCLKTKIYNMKVIAFFNTIPTI